MVVKGRFFHSKKSSDISSPEGSNSPRSVGSNSSSPIKSDNKKAKSSGKDEHRPPISGSFRQNQVIDGSNSSSTSSSKHQSRSKKDVVQGLGLKVHDTTPVTEKASLRSGSSKLTRKGAAEGAATVSPILASSVGLNRIKTRSGPLPQESFFGFSRDGNGNDSKNKVNSKMSSLGASNLSKLKNSDASNFKEGFGSNPDSMSIASLPSRDHTPNVLGCSHLQNGEPSSEACSRVHSGPTPTPTPAPLPPMDSVAIEALIAQSVAAALANYSANRHEGSDHGNDSFLGESRGRTCVCTYKDFAKCKPKLFYGDGGALALIWWFEKTESVFESVLAQMNRK